MGRDAVVFTVSHRESDLWVAVDRGDAAVMAARTEHFLHELRGRLDRYLDRDPAYLRALVPCLPRPDGRADAVMIVCRDVLLADSYATAWANRVRTEEDTGSVVERACRVPEILGAMAVKGERLAVGGTFELRLFGEARDF